MLVDPVEVVSPTCSGAVSAGLAIDAATAPVASSALVDMTAVTVPTALVANRRRDAEYRTGATSLARRRLLAVVAEGR